MTIAGVHSAHGTAVNGTFSEEDGHLRCEKGLATTVHSYVEEFHGNVPKAFSQYTRNMSHAAVMDEVRF